MSSEHNWIELFSAAALGGGVVKVLDRVFDYFAHLSGKRTAARSLLNKHLDPVIKAAEELSSKLRFLARADFQPIVEAKKTTLQIDLSGQQLIETGSLLYLFLQFWGRLGILRAESTYIDLGVETKGIWVLAFMRTLESRDFHILSRDLQRLLGEAMIASEPKGERRIFTFFEFVSRYGTDEAFRRWCNEMRDAVYKLSGADERQKLLRYTVVVTAMAETLAGKESVRRARSIANKLTHRSRQQLRHDVFEKFLSFVDSRWDYCGTQKKQPSAHVPPE